MKKDRKFRLADIVYSAKNPVRPYGYQKLTYIVTQICEDCYELLSNDGEYINLPFTDEANWNIDAPISGYDRNGEYITTDDIQIESFYFKYVPDDDYDWIDLPYRMQLGGKTMESCISEWAINYEQIRHDLENLIFHDQTEIRLCFEDSSTIIKLTRTFVQDREKFNVFGTFYGWTYLMRIEIYPDEFVREKFPPIIGYAGYVETLRELYEGLLDALRAYPEENEESPQCNRATMYGQLHSTRLEEYIKNCPYSEHRRMSDYYSSFINVNFVSQPYFLIPNKQQEIIRIVAEKAADKFIDERKNGRSVSEAHKSAAWLIEISLDRYRIKL